MKKFVAVLAALLIAGAGSSVAFGDPPQGKALRRVGVVRSGANVNDQAAYTNGTITTSGTKVRMIVVSAGGTATNVGFINADTANGAVQADWVIDVSAVANTTTVLDFTNCPLDFSAGVSVCGDSNATGVSVYEYQNE